MPKRGSPDRGLTAVLRTLTFGGTKVILGFAKRATAAVVARFRYVSLSVLIPQLFLGLAWLRASVAHAVDPVWWTGQEIVEFVDGSADTGLPFYTFFVEMIVRPLAVPLTVFVVALQGLLGLLFVTNVRPRSAALASLFLSSNFIMAGHVNPSIFYVVLALVVLFLSIEAMAGSKMWKTLSIQATVSCFVVVVFCWPFVQSVDPMLVIGDPAVVLITVAVISTAACWITYGRMLLFPALAFGVDSLHDSGASTLVAPVEASEVTEGQAVVPEGDLDVDDTLAEDANQVEVGVDVDDAVEVGSEARSDDGVKVVDNDDEHSEESASGINLTVVRDAAVDGHLRGDEEAHWFSVRCHFQLASNTYEERITIWLAAEFEAALEMAEQEARDHAAERGAQYLESCDGYRMTESTLNAQPGQQIYSLIRTSSLAPAAYLRQFFFTGAEQSLYA